MTPTTTRIEIAKEDMHFSAAHFTIFSASERENLHGHNFFVAADAVGRIGEDGLCFDYNALKSRLRTLCEALDEIVLLPADSPYLTVAEGDDDIIVTFAGERLSFLRRDVKLLPLRNVTVEELARYFIDELAADCGFLDLPIDSLQLRVSSGPGQWAEVTWERPQGEAA